MLLKCPVCTRDQDAASKEHLISLISLLHRSRIWDLVYQKYMFRPIDHSRLPTKECIHFEKIGGSAQAKAINVKI